MKKLLVFAGLFAALALTPLSMPPAAEAKPSRAEIREGLRDAAKVRREVRREVRRGIANQARRGYNYPRWEYERRRGEVRREIRREIRRRYFGRLIAGVVLGSIIRVAVAGRVPSPPSAELCWYWTSDTYDRGYWYYCNDN